MEARNFRVSNQQEMSGEHQKKLLLLALPLVIRRGFSWYKKNSIDKVLKARHLVTL
jgi:hypothetical protein